MTITTDATTTDVVAELTRAGVTDVDDSTLTRALYSTDASLYRVVPQVVVRPRSTEEVLATIAACRATGTPLTSRGAGTSIAGNAVGTGVVMDFTRHLNRVHDIDVEARTARVEPGTVHAVLQKAATPLGLRFGPDPSTHTRCTVGGMIGNNACGSRALAYGRTADNVIGMDVVTMAGEQLTIGRGATPTSPTLDALRDLVGANLATVRTEFGRFGRQVSGYSLEHLLPENGFDVATFMAGTEGTLATMTSATVRLVKDPPHRQVLVLGYASMAEAADDVPSLLPFAPTACEGLDSRIVDVFRAHRGAVPDLPRGQGWLFLEISGEHPGEVADTIARASRAASAIDHRVVTDGGEQAVLWRIREEGAGLATRTLPGKALSGWEDAAVPPERLGTYLRELDGLLKDNGLDGVPYGHFGDGCVHIRIDFPLDAEGGHQVFRRFLTDAATQVAALGGSLSGEHGDGRARSELLPLMYSGEAISLFEQVKAVLDPDDLLNPGVLVRPAAVDADLRGPESIRSPGREQLSARLGLRLLHDDGDLGKAVHRCTGVGKCIADNSGSNGVMCPSFQATREEKDSTRGRARVLQEMIDGRLVTGGYRAPEVHEALDLCLSCKGCLSDCPTGIDMASYKSEVLHQTYKGRLRPRSHYILGKLPFWARLSSPVAWLANLGLRTPGLRSIARWVAGVDQRRSLPAFATRRFSRIARPQLRGDRAKVVIWADSFTEFFSTDGGQAALRVLDGAGYDVEVLSRPQCCGLTWITTGQLDTARTMIGRAVEQLHPYVAAGVPVVGLEPSCLAVLRSDAVELVDDPRAVDVAAGVFTLSELLQRTEGWTPPDLTGTTLVVQPHCHQSSVLGFEADLAIMTATGATIDRLSGCCGLAGNFGVEKGHYEVSVAVAEQQLMPAIRKAPPGAVVVADGFSCRTQLDDLAAVQAVHLAQLLDRPGPR
ncbi:FAD-binding and (Fe-S)-binding domain-containing protein [Aeromicrobium wangtongii]|uniref:FAD-binding oxidoreductase n=1 Tax=Aeromicrobium wangtongii TaxID=2969247 RepID=A0ABY5M8U2_9ACTN|nr:FAD-binding and (Fe-S)-binding domain-containing protein [Aeromicrobium wangtongii]MCD9198776.1 FAD-binding oxidoreductase [Aeromicrobium wangtongii]UUP13182.1 FAD-binding oxidoreductase [Aeromicrobium wangtongii]